VAEALPQISEARLVNGHRLSSATFVQSTDGSNWIDRANAGWATATCIFWSRWQ
jgi:hypothetical protein